MLPRDANSIPFKFTKTNYEFLTGTWSGHKGLIYNITGEDCFEAGLGTYSKPTEKGQKFIEKFLEEHRL